jgi:hypothetical protein
VEDEPRWTTTETEVGEYAYEYKDTQKSKIPIIEESFDKRIIKTQIPPKKPQ